MALASALRKAANKVLKAVGADVTIRRVTTGTYNAATGKSGETLSDTTVKGFVEDINKREVSQLVQSDDRLLTIAASSLTYVPTTADRVVISGSSYQIIRVKIIEQDNTAISYELILRG
tara:strand:- start:287 stop:643 length:357 start_codon:yes stop_codon:yes gene_type:complete